jgi:hypothetical protein
MACVLAAGLAARAAEPDLPVAASAATPGAPTATQVQAEVDRLRADPDLSGTEKHKTLRFTKDWFDRKPAKKASSDGFGAWLRDAGRWLADAGRVMVWLLGALVVALVLVGLRHWVRVRAAGGRMVKQAVLPSHVRELDIRPESLPDQVGAAAAALWQKGEHRAALSLLYRGALSRLVHDHAVPIRAASTEGECVALAASRLAPARSAFFGRLVQAWQLAVYGARLPDSASVLALCSEFDLQLRATPAKVSAP